MKAYRGGEGMGMAKAAELNGYPGPRHVLDTATALELTNAQREAIEDSYRRMKTTAVSLGEQVVEVERRLDALFARREASVDAISSLVRQAAGLQGELRAVHLGAHVETRRVPTPEQIRRYVELRGYGHEHH